MRKILLPFLAGLVVASLAWGSVFYFHEKDRKLQTEITAALPEAVGVSQSVPAIAAVPPSASTPGNVPVPNAPPAPNASKSTSEETALFKQMVSKNPNGHSIIYVVQPKDTLIGIARRHKVAPDLIKRVNALSTDRIQLGMKLKIPNYKLSLYVSKSQNSLILKGDDAVLKTYVVSTGSNNSSPVGIFKITDKLVNPTWYKAGAVVPSGSPQNVLGTRWMGIDKQGYGIHGTTEPEKLGQQCTAGCVRMKNEDVEELYAIVPAGTEVTIVD